MDRNFRSRRELLKGTLAAPVVLTVSSPSAAASSFARCLVNMTDTKVVDEKFFSITEDQWFRAPVRVLSLWSQGSALGDFYDDPVKKVFVNVRAPYTVLPYGEATMPAYVKVSSTSTRWALVWFDETSTTKYSVITLQRPSGSSATTLSCYGSFTKAAA